MRGLKPQTMEMMTKIKMQDPTALIILQLKKKKLL
jgi:hypothetical protein